MACRAIPCRDRAGSAGMAHGCRCKGGVIFVAGVALRCGGDVRGRLGLGVDRDISPAVASRTITGCTRANRAGVAHGGRGEGGVIRVTGVALGRGRDMGAGFACCCGAIVAGRTNSGDRWNSSRMVEGSGPRSSR